jgi:hypothetical protein
MVRAQETHHTLFPGGPARVGRLGGSDSPIQATVAGQPASRTSTSVQKVIKLGIVAALCVQPARIVLFGLHTPRNLARPDDGSWSPQRHAEPVRRSCRPR